MSNSLSIIDTKKIEADRSLPFLAHHIPGRVRFRIYRLKYNSDYAANLQQFLLAQPGINGVRVNRVAASIAINYRYKDAPLAEIASGLTKLIQQSAKTKSIPSKQTQEQNSEIENWSSLTLPVFTTIVSWLSNQSGLIWLRPVALASLVTVTLPIVKLIFPVKCFGQAASLHKGSVILTNHARELGCQ